MTLLLCPRCVPESPRWLISQNKDAKAMKIIKHIAKKNGKSLPTSLQVSQQLKYQIREQWKGRFGKTVHCLNVSRVAEAAHPPRATGHFCCTKICGSLVEYFKQMENKTKGSQKSFKSQMRSFYLVHLSTMLPLRPRYLKSCLPVCPSTSSGREVFPRGKILQTQIIS